MSNKIISSDNHIVEPPDLWATRIDSKFKDRAPRVVDVEGGQIWVIDDQAGSSFIQGTQAGTRFDNPEDLSNVMDSFENVRPGAYMPDEAIKDLKLDGVDAGIVYATECLVLYNEVKDTELLNAIFRAYNDFCSEFCSAHPKILKGVGFINLDDVDVAVKELIRCANMGLIGAAIPAFNERMRYKDPALDPFWAAAQDYEMPISLHIATNRLAPHNPEFGRHKPAPLFLDGQLVNGDYWVRQSMLDMIMGGVFERFPKLKVGSVENELAWALFFVQRLDYNYQQSAYGWAGYRFKNDMQPSDFFRRNCFIDTQEDFLGISVREHIGVDNILWGNDYPHIESTFPKSMEFLEKMLADCSEDEKEKITGGNARRIYRMD